jgi:hypothetical protein
MLNRITNSVFCRTECVLKEERLINQNLCACLEYCGALKHDRTVFGFANEGPKFDSPYFVKDEECVVDGSRLYVGKKLHF